MKRPNYSNEALAGFLVAMAMFTASFSLNAATEILVEGMYYNLDINTLTAQLRKSYPDKNGVYTTFSFEGDVRIPDRISYNGVTFTVTSVVEDCFRYQSKMTSLTIPPTITEFSGDNAFDGCNALAEVILEDGEKPIKFSSFKLGYNNYSAFYPCPLTKAHVGRSITGASPFSDISYLTNVTIGTKVKTICHGFLSGCGISEIVIPEGVETIESNAFKNCEKLKELALPNSVKSIGSSLCSKSALESIYIGDGITNIPSLMCYDCTKLNQIFIGSGVRSIDKTAFGNCSSLTSIYLFSNIVSPYDNSYAGINPLIYVSDPSMYTNVFEGSHLEKLIYFNSSSAVYSGKIPNLSYTNNTPIEDIEIIPNESYANVGTYSTPISVRFRQGAWSSTAQIKASYSITPAPLTILANDASKRYGEENPEMTCSFFGFKNGETKDVLAKLPIVETTATKTSNAGTYPIIPSGAEAQNYSFIYERGTLTINKAPQTIYWNQQFDGVSVGDIIELTATSSAGLPVKYSSSDETVADIFTQNGKKYVEILKTGTASIRADQEGNENYSEAERVSKKINVKAILVTGISLNKANLSLKTGESFQIEATVSPTSADNKALKWKSSNEAVATVDQSGKVRAVGPGGAVITVEAADGSGATASCSVSVNQPVTSISINETKINLYVGQSTQLTASVTPENASNKTLSWTSSDEKVAKVSENGNVVAISAGTAIVRVSTTDASNLYATCEVSVKTLVSGISLNETSLILKSGESFQLQASVTPASAENKKLNWTSSNEAVATVDQSGRVRAVGPGGAVINAEATDGSGITASCSVSVNQPITSISINETKIKLYEGQSTQLTASVAPENASNKTLSWTSSDEKVVKVSEGGKVVAISAGTAIIRVSTTDSSNLYATCEISVEKLISGIVLNETSATLAEGQSLQLIAAVSPTPTAGVELEWWSSNKAVATVDGYGKVEALAKGTAIIYVRSKDNMNVVTSCQITVFRPVQDIFMETSELTLRVGDSYRLQAYVLPTDASYQGLMWKSTDNNIVSVSQASNNNTIYALAKGSVIITVTSTDGTEVSKTCRVTVSELNGVEDVESSEVSIFIENDKLHISGKMTDEIVTVYTLQGAMVAATYSDEIELHQKGVYIIRFRDKSYKIRF